MKNMTVKIWILIIFCDAVLADSVEDYSVQVSTTVLENPPGLLFEWPVDPTAAQYFVFRKAISDTVWAGPIAVLSGSAIEFTDRNISAGEAFEYGFYKNLNFFTDTVTVAHGTSLLFSIYDSWGDGIAPNHGIGWYQVSGIEQIYASGGVFGAEEVTHFTVDAGGPGEDDTVVVSLQLDVFGDETSWTLARDGSGTVLLEGDGYQAPRFGHIFAGIEYPAIESRGSVLLVVDGSIASQLSSELERLRIDLICDGWTVRRIDVGRDTPVPSVKEQILSQCTLDPDINTLFVFGHVPVPYSGNVMSAHSNHCGAYPTDIYYAELDDIWTDSLVNNTTAARPANHNVPGDGKFDQTFIESGVDLQNGRVDLYDMPAFPESEVELLRRYLGKNHDFRRGIMVPEQRGLIDDNVGVLGGIAPAGNGLRNFASMFGADNQQALDYFGTMEDEDYLWSLGCGPGSYTSCGGVGTTSDFATRTVHSVFTILYGSYFGDWDNTNNLLRAPLGAEGSLLSCCWAGAPNWHFHHMALGETIGYSAMVSQNNISLYTPTDRARQVPTSLMGDPTLRLHPVTPPSSLMLSVSGCSVDLSWNPSTDEGIIGYHIYRSGDLNGQFERLSSDIITGLSWKDDSPLHNRNIYMVRAYRLEVTGSGTYYNLSLGIIDSTEVSVPGPDPFPPASSTIYRNFPNPFAEQTQIDFFLTAPGFITLTVYDLCGRIVANIIKGEVSEGLHSVEWNGLTDDGSSLGNGVYLLRLSSSGGSMSRHLSILK